MNTELFGVGRTWLVAIVLIVGATVLMFAGKIDQTIWQNMVYFAFGGGAAKSTLVGVAGALPKKKE